MRSKEIRQLFLNFFLKKKHLIVSSDSIVLQQDPPLMFTNAGMNQFKDIFLGIKPIINKRIANIQKCLRVSGKHNDLEEVGLDTYHHTMFEMLGNWSFGDYFKAEAIAFAWEFLTKYLKIEEENLFSTYYGGDKEVGIDLECLQIWKNYLPPSRIIKGTKKDNFWEMGETGPCGPCSEIHIDIRSTEQRKKIAGESLINKNHPEVIEIWNLVFIEFNRSSSGELLQLSKKYIDTGMGFERLCMVLQGKTSSYDTDLFQPIIRKIEDISSYNYGRIDKKEDIAIRVIADHIRAVTFSVADGQLPSNTKAGYVIRRILRRAVRYGYTFLQIKQPFFYLLVDVVSDILGEQYPELEKNKELITKIIYKEEESFFKTLDNGTKLLEKIISQSKRKNEKILSGRIVFLLYDTYGFPHDLTSLIADENGLSVDLEEFDKELNKQKNRSKIGKKYSADGWINISNNGLCTFTGYDKLTENNVKIIRYRKIKENNKHLYQLVFDNSPFYGEAGGQIGDIGYMKNGKKKIFIIDTKKQQQQIIHYVKELPKEITARFKIKVDKKRRLSITKNHSATHLLHYGLKKILGNHIEQKGSYVGDSYLSFDFSHYSKISAAELFEIEYKINQLISKSIPLYESRELDKNKALKMGAVALFGEKYTSKVRLIKFNKSVELCGGTHVKNTGEIGWFKIISESSIAAGIRRIEAITNTKAQKYVAKKLTILKTIETKLKCTDEKLIYSVEKLLQENKKYKKKLSENQKEKNKHIKQSLIAKSKSYQTITLIVDILQDNKLQDIKDISFQLKREKHQLAIIIGNVSNQKVQIIIGFSNDLVKKYNVNASKIIKNVAKHINGGGGGQAFFATAGGTNIKGLEKALQLAKDMIKQQINNQK